MPRDRVYGVFNKRIYTTAQLWADLRRVNWRIAAGVWLRHTLDRQTREAVMLAVSHAHDCRYCAFIHREWALHTGLPLSVISGIESGLESSLESGLESGPGSSPESGPDVDGRSPKDPRWLATTYAEALVRADFGPVAPLVAAAVAVEFSPAHRHRVETTARIMTVLNRGTNTVDALRERLGGNPVTDSRLFDELTVSVFAWTVTLPMLLVAGVLRRVPGARRRR